MRNILVLMVLLTLPFACATSRTDQQLTQIEHGLRPLVLVAGDETWSIESRMQEYGVPGVSVAVFRNGRLDWARGYGIADRDTQRPVTPETLFQAGSISKGVSAMGALALVQRGQLTLDKDINDVLVSWQVPSNEHTAVAPVTLAGLLSHTAGLSVHGFPGYESGTSVPTIVQMLDATPPVNTPPVRVVLDPGTEHLYSGGGYTVAQLAMMDVTGRLFPQLMQALVLGPLGMSASTYEQPLPTEFVANAAAGYRDDGTPVPGKRHVYPEMAAAGLSTTAGDIVRFAIGVQDMLRGEPGPLTAASVANMLTPRLSNYALGLQLEGSYFMHGGADDGFRTLLYAHRTKAYGIAIMTNSDNGTPLMREILFAVAAAYGWDDFDTGPVAAAELPAEVLAAYAGRYARDRASVLTLSVRGRALLGELSLAAPVEFIPVSDHEFVSREYDVRLLFHDGELTIEDAGVKAVLPRVGRDAAFPDDDLEAGRLDAAVAGYRRLYLENAADPMVAEQRLADHGSILLERKQVRAAVAVLELNLQLRPDSVEACDNLAKVLEAAGDRAGAIARYRQAIELASRPAEFWLQRNAVVRSHAVARLQVLAGG